MSWRRRRSDPWRGRAPALARVERAADARRERARVHLARLHGRERLRPAPRVALLVFATSVAAGALLGSSWVDARPARIDAIHVRGAERLSLAEIAEATGVAPGAALRADEASTVAQRLAEHAWIAEARAVRLPAGELVIEIQERRALAVLGAEPGAGLLVDVAGMPFAPATPEDLGSLPRLIAASGATPGKPDAALAQAVELARGLDRRDLPPTTRVSVSAPDDPEGFVLEFEGHPARVVLGWEDLTERLDVLERVVAAALPELEGAQVIDLRFADQVVLREPPRKGRNQRR